MKDFVEFYSHEYDEDTRLKRHPVEFAATTFVLDKLIAGCARILDIGAGAGAYSMYYAGKGCSLTAIDAVPKNIEILKGKIRSQPGLDIKTYVADIRTPPAGLGTDFDVVLFMGPVYHLPLDDTRRCLDYCLQLLKTNGILAVSYVNKHEGHQNSRDDDVFIAYHPEEIKALLGRRIGLLFHGPTDGEVFGELNEASLEMHNGLSGLHAWLEQHRSVYTAPPLAVDFDSWPLCR